MMKNRITERLLKPVLVLTLALLSAAMPTMAVESTSVTYFHNDLLGSPIAATDEVGNLKWQQSYAPYGSTLEQEDSDNNVGYTGHRIDKDIGLTYAGARFYDHELGRFTGIDPVGALATIDNPMMFNRYAYVYNNPYKYVDPDGNLGVLGHSPWGGGFGSAAASQLTQTQRVELVDNLTGATDTYNAVQQLASGDIGEALYAVALVGCKGCKIADKATKASKLQRKVNRQQVPKGIKRFDSAEEGVPSSQDHVHFDDGTSLNVDGSIHDKKNGVPKLTNKQKTFLKKENWPTKVNNN